MYYAHRLDSITVSTRANPDQPEIEDFKKRVKEALKRGYKPDGQMKTKEDGSLVQQFSKRNK